MKAASLFSVLVLSHVIMLAGAPIPVSVWTPLAFLWQDALAALIFAGLDYVTGRGRVGWILYALAVIYVAVNVPIALFLSSPLTLTMFRAAGGPLLDSIQHHLTAVNLFILAVIGGAAIALPMVFARMSKPGASGFGPRLVLAAFAIVVLGPIAQSRIETLGFHRNAFGALIPFASAGVDTRDADRAWRISPFADVSLREDILHYRGRAAGRNVVLIVLESTGAQYLRPYGAAEDPMPHLTELASRSIVFENAYAVYPESIKGLLSTLCSTYPAYNTPAEVYADATCASVAQRLREAGYRTALFHSGRSMYLGMDAIIHNRGFSVLEDAGAIGGNVNSSFGVDEQSTVRRILSWVDSTPRSERFFITYLPIAGHHPYATPEPGPFSADSEIGRYKNALHDGDAALGELFRGFRERGLDETTLFIVFGDHGEAFGQHPRNFGHTLFIYDENVRVPYIIAAPGLLTQQTRIRRSASLIDSAPTILDLLGLPLSDEFQGSSLLDPTPLMTLFFTDYSLGWAGLRDGCWKYFHEIGSRRSKLFNVCSDAQEVTDLSGEHEDRTAAYRSILARKMGT